MGLSTGQPQIRAVERIPAVSSWSLFLASINLHRLNCNFYSSCGGQQQQAAGLSDGVKLFGHILLGNFILFAQQKHLQKK